MNAVARNYIKAVKKYLVCSAEYRNRYLELVEKDAEACLEENPGASTEDLEKLIGPPKATAESYMEDVPPKILQTYRQKRNRNRKLAVVLGVVLVAALILLVTYMGRMHGGYIVAEKTVVYGSGPAGSSSSAAVS